MGNTGYTNCACRDCFEIAIGLDGAAFCHDCEQAGCDCKSECQAPNAYGITDDEEEANG